MNCIDEASRQQSVLLLMSKLMTLRRNLDEKSGKRYRMALVADPDDGRLVLRSVQVSSEEAGKTIQNVSCDKAVRKLLPIGPMNNLSIPVPGAFNPHKLSVMIAQDLALRKSDVPTDSVET